MDDCEPTTLEQQPVDKTKSVDEADVAECAAADEMESSASVDSNSTRSSVCGDAAQFVCRHCDRSFSTASNRNRHVKSMHSGVHKCEKCKVNFDTYNELRKHRSVEHPQMHKCSVCDYSNRQSYQVKRHEEQSHGESAVRCSYEDCFALLPLRQLGRHVREVHAIKREKVQAEGEKAKTAATQVIPTAPIVALEERRVETERQARIRSQAHKIFEEVAGKMPEDFKAISMASSADVDFQCETCGQRRKTRSQLRRHIARVHERRYAPYAREKRYVCTEDNCGKAFTCATLLEDHLNKHRGERPFECAHCTRSFAARAGYAEHLRKYHSTTIRDVFSAALTADVIGALRPAIEKTGQREDGEEDVPKPMYTQSEERFL